MAIPWSILTKNNIELVFITPKGFKAKTDIKMLTGKKLWIWKPLLQARKDAVDAYNELEKDYSFCNPLKYTDVEQAKYDPILLTGGHDKGVIVV